MNKLGKYLNESKAELAKVAWPNRAKTINHTLVVIGVSLAVALFLGLVDFLLVKILELVIS
ncbi:MAG: preprotein translocase subunit SecE [Patescibacteria group bacterium]|nr:preprotein translocase subunit SecE [Patescibacteria group bacterium]